MKTLGIIPARYASTRFPGKPLVDIHGKPMIQRVWEQVQKASQIDEIVVATDDKSIYETVLEFGGNVAMTSKSCKTGTDRCAEVIQNSDSYDFVVNIQGDEPFIAPSQIDTVVNILKNNSSLEISTLAQKIKESKQLFDPNIVKIVMDLNQKAIYFSRSPIPYLRNQEKEKWLEQQNYFKHIGLYAFKTQTLLEIAALDQTPLEKSESLEQLRWLENGYSIGVGLTDIDTIGIDTPEDLEKILNSWKNDY